MADNNQDGAQEHRGQRQPQRPQRQPQRPQQPPRQPQRPQNPRPDPPDPRAPFELSVEEQQAQFNAPPPPPEALWRHEYLLPTELTMRLPQPLHLPLSQAAYREQQYQQEELLNPPLSIQYMQEVCRMMAILEGMDRLNDIVRIHRDLVEQERFGFSQFAAPELLILEEDRFSTLTLVGAIERMQRELPLYRLRKALLSEARPSVKSCCAAALYLRDAIRALEDAQWTLQRPGRGRGGGRGGQNQFTTRERFAVCRPADQLLERTVLTFPRFRRDITPQVATPTRPLRMPCRRCGDVDTFELAVQAVLAKHLKLKQHPKNEARNYALRRYLHVMCGRGEPYRPHPPAAAYVHVHPLQAIWYKFVRFRCDTMGYHLRQHLEDLWQQMANHPVQLMRLKRDMTLVVQLLLEQAWGELELEVQEQADADAVAARNYGQYPAQSLNGWDTAWNIFTRYWDIRHMIQGQGWWPHIQRLAARYPEQLEANVRAENAARDVFMEDGDDAIPAPFEVVDFTTGTYIGARTLPKDGVLFYENVVGIKTIPNVHETLCEHCHRPIRHEPVPCLYCTVPFCTRACAGVDTNSLNYGQHRTELGRCVSYQWWPHVMSRRQALVARLVSFAGGIEPFQAQMLPTQQPAATQSDALAYRALALRVMMRQVRVPVTGHRPKLIAAAQHLALMLTCLSPRGPDESFWEPSDRLIEALYRALYFVSVHPFSKMGTTRPYIHARAPNRDPEQQQQQESSPQSQDRSRRSNWNNYGNALGVLGPAAFGFSCQPNINRLYNPNLGRIYYAATRPIAPGEGLTTKHIYIDEFHEQRPSPEVRRAKMMATYGQVCQCVHCNPRI